MKKYFLRIAAICSVLLVSAACAEYDVNEILLERDEVSLTIKGDLHFRYTPADCQLGYSPDRNEFRAYDDRLGDWFVLRCSSDPRIEGEKVKGSLEYTTSDSKVNLDGLDFVVRRISHDGYVWLWSDGRKIGLVVKRL